MVTNVPFIFGGQIEGRGDDLRVTIPPRISSKNALLTELAVQLRFPAYFGENWDAFQECIRDLSWLPPARVILSHADLPLAGDVKNLQIYVEILRDAVQKMSKSEHEVVVLFPNQIREQIEWLPRARPRK
jgi:hypothetical protein